MSTDEFRRAIREALGQLYGDRLVTAILYGSEAAGANGPDSDVDVLVVLTGPVDYARELRRTVRALYPLTLEVGRPVSPKIVSEAEYAHGGSPLLRDAREQGIPI